MSVCDGFLVLLTKTRCLFVGYPGFEIHVKPRAHHFQLHARTSNLRKQRHDVVHSIYRAQLSSLLLRQAWQRISHSNTQKTRFWQYSLCMKAPERYRPGLDPIIKPGWLFLSTGCIPKVILTKNTQQTTYYVSTWVSATCVCQQRLRLWTHNQSLRAHSPTMLASWSHTTSQSCFPYLQ